ncbi:MAG TPA: sigma-70 family RNA polymerase sigma factor [Verrucomicrobiae bacterium]|jgi:RNA polymerase sigma-70 factor (ECF subfamily)|nr:sigma-70 family RNA polymerase sigma factor [Verrucomicrobiae bacterium]
MARGEKYSPAKTTAASGGRNAAFATTHWSIVLEASRGELVQSAAAMEKLCQRYWYPIYAFVRRRGSDRQEAEDLTQAFFAHLLERDTLKKVDPKKGKFRTFLLASLSHFLANEWDKRQTWKRGGRAQTISLHEANAEEIYGREPIEPATPEKLFDRRWALLLVEAVLARLREEYANKPELFTRLEPALTGELSPGWYAEAAASLDMTEGALRVALHRLRRRFGELLRREIGQTVATETDIDDEIRQLFSAMTS